MRLPITGFKGPFQTTLLHGRGRKAGSSRPGGSDGGLRLHPDAPAAKGLAALPATVAKTHGGDSSLAPLSAKSTTPQLHGEADPVVVAATPGDSTLSASFMRPDQERAAKFNGEDDTTTFWGMYGESILPGLPTANVNAYSVGIRREDTPYATGTATEHVIGRWSPAII